MLPAMSRRGNGASRRVTVLTAALLSVAVGAGTLAGCSTEEEPAPQAQDQKKSKPKPEPTPDEPELPEKLDKPYVHVVLDYYEAWHDALGTGDTDSFMKYATENCVSCGGMKDQIEETLAKGGSSELSSLEPVLGSKRNMAQSNTANEANVMLHYRYGKFTRIAKSGADPNSWPEEETVEQVSLVREGGKWLIEEITPLQLDGQ